MEEDKRSQGKTGHTGHATRVPFFHRAPSCRFGFFFFLSSFSFRQSKVMEAGSKKNTNARGFTAQYSRTSL